MHGFTAHMVRYKFHKDHGNPLSAEAVTQLKSNPLRKNSHDPRPHSNYNLHKRKDISNRLQANIIIVLETRENLINMKFNENNNGGAPKARARGLEVPTCVTAQKEQYLATHLD